ncbi:MAG: RNase adapter RapZ [Myxococcales bacterium]|nr:RNase adapter RapZ [Myxococcales bacterium]
MRIVVLTGLSGSGKSNAIRALEDIGYYAIDNLPIPLMEQLVELFASSQGESEKLALVVDARTSIRSGIGDSHELAAVPKIIESIKQQGHRVDLVFMDAADEVLFRRFSETRRRHPSSEEGSVLEGIDKERELLSFLKSAATMILHTSEMSVHDLRRHIQDVFLQRSREVEARLQTTVMSFGFKYGIPQEADLLFDVRFISNPYFVEGLRAKTGEDAEVAQFVLEQTETEGFLNHLKNLFDFILPLYLREGKAYLTVAIGCTGGRHRSVVLAIHMSNWLKQRGIPVRIAHRDIRR